MLAVSILNMVPFIFFQVAPPLGFVDLRRVIPDIQIDLRYATSNNFVGEIISGYCEPTCLMTEESAFRLKEVQSRLHEFGLGLKVFDAYRPQRAVDHFVRWAADLDDNRQKDRFYPKVPKTALFSEGYIANKSGHSRGSTVDLTLVDIETGYELAMGSEFDFFGPVSAGLVSGIPIECRVNRMLLQEVMIQFGFRPYKQEWWHFTLREEPFPDTYFDFSLGCETDPPLIMQ